ncbi:helix-turn-helix domain-containing protein [Variovorax sp. LjRoot290]|uniref:helix-turn-helix domain-containing protein n=1 Tax=unclassified Variovorax TaxID=663243 RepID=UPI003ECED520
MDYAVRLADQLRAHLRALRKQRGLTQAQLGQRLGIGQARMAEIEARPGLVSVDQLMQLLSALGATLVLREGAESAAASAPVLAREPDPGQEAAKPLVARRSKSAVEPPTVKPPAKTASKRASTPLLTIPPKKGSW